MGRLLRGIWRSVTAIKNFVGNLLFLCILVVVLVAIFSQTEQVSIPDSTAMIINPTGTIVEQKRAIDPLAGLLGNTIEQESETLLSDVTSAISAAKNDNRVKALVLELSGMQGVSMAQLQEIGVHIDDFKAAGKLVFAYAESYSQSQYYLAAHADHLFLNKQSFEVFGGVFMTGMGVYPTYFKSALDKLKVQFHIFKVGTYKGAVEPYLRDDMSADAKEANLGWLQVLWQQYLARVGDLRGLAPETLNQHINTYDKLLDGVGGDAGRLAVQQGLVDEQISRKQWFARVHAVVGSNIGSDSGEDFSHIGFRDYLLATRPPMVVNNPSSDKIAVITAKGNILDGDQPAGSIGSDSMAELIKRAREDETVKALVVRIDSPGGSASASEHIRYELELTQQEGKPVIVSMGTYAASGGYWIAATADRIFASTTTITGSIGTFLLFPTLDQSLAELGIYSDGVGTTTLSGALNPLQAINPTVEKILSQSINHTYAQFIGLVAKGRNMSPEAVDSVAQGRVWAGATALDLGLIDAIGNLDDAVRAAASIADITDFETIYLEKALTPRERLISELMEGGTDAMVSLIGHSNLQLALPFTQQIKELHNMSKKPGLYLQCLECQSPGR
ncbi:MAG: protease-4 [Candidatus Pseudothioglobus sp.]|jgi:protease-4